MVILAVDLGKVRTGLAVCDKTELMAFPLGTVEERNRERLLSKIAELVKERKAEMLVIGLPRNMDGSEGESAENARMFAENLSEICHIPYVMQDERGTTLTAHHFLNTTDKKKKKRKKIVDTVSAVIILEDYLSLRKNEGMNLY